MINKQKIMQTKITIRNEAQTCFIDIEGTIGVEREDSVGSSGVATYEAFRREVERITQVAAQHVVGARIKAYFAYCSNFSTTEIKRGS